jgi:hypothetical protein
MKQVGSGSDMCRGQSHLGLSSAGHLSELSHISMTGDPWFLPGLLGLASSLGTAFRFLFFFFLSHN